MISLKSIKSQVFILSLFTTSLVASNDTNYSIRSQSTKAKLERTIEEAKKPKCGNRPSPYRHPACVAKLEDVLEACTNNVNCSTVSQQRESESVTRCQKQSCCKKKNCAQCKVIPFSLGNGLPKGTKGAIPNSDGSFGPFVISKPGTYLLQNSAQMEITGATAGSPNIAILIESSDVYVDLCHQTLHGSGNLTAPLSPEPTVPGGIQNDTRVDACYGIFINPNFVDLHNISIVNGSLEYFSMAGAIFQNARDITFENLTIENCSDLIQYDNYNVGGIAGFLGTNILVNNVNFFHNYNSDFSALQTNNIIVSNCTSAQLRGGGGAAKVFHDYWLAIQDYVDFGGYADPYAFTFSNNILIENCNVTDVKAGGVVYGLCLIYGGIGATVRNCMISDIAQVLQDITVFGEDFIFGIEIEGIAFGVTIGSLTENCTVQNISCAVQNLYDVFIYPFPGNGVTAFNVEAGQGAVFKNCYATNVSSAGKITTQIPSRVSNKLISDNAATGFQRQVDASPGNNAIFIDCVAQNINGGNGAALGMESPGLGFSIYDGFGDQPFILNLATIFENCSAQDCFGSAASAGFGLQTPAYFRFPIVFENCIAQFDRISNPTGLSNGFLIPSYGNNVTFRNCIAKGHSLNGFDIAGYAIDDTSGNTKMILDNCIANANSGQGFKLDHTVNKVELVNCKATSNGNDGFNAVGRNVIFRECISDLNGTNAIDAGFNFEAYFPFFALVATDTDLADLPIYTQEANPGYNVVYYPAISGGTGSETYFLQLIPNNPNAPLPAFLPINDVPVKTGDLVLVKDEVDGLLNGMYQANNAGGASWQGFMNVFELPVHGGGYVFGSPWATTDLVAEFNAADNTLILSPNVNVWNPNDPFWVQPDGTPNKIMDAILYFQSDSLIDTDVVFNATCLSNTLTVEPLTGIEYSSVAFINAFDANYNLINRVTADLITGESFTVTLNTTGAAHVQFGFETIGPDADPATVATLGNVVIAGINPAIPCWQLVRIDPWRAPYTIPAGTKVLVAESNAPNLTPGPVMYTLLNDTTVDVDTPTFAATQAIVPDISTIIVDTCKAGANAGAGVHNSALKVVVRNTTCDFNGGTGFLDDSIGGALANHNLYTLNKAYDNKAGLTYLDNYDIDYVIPANPTVLQQGSVASATFPVTTGEANVSITQ